VNESSQNTPAADLSTHQTYLVRTASRPDIVCPTWCAVDADQHLDDLASHDGCVLHVGWVPLADPVSVKAQLFAATLVDGRPGPDDQDLRIRLVVERDHHLRLDEAIEMFARVTRYLRGIVMP